MFTKAHELLRDYLFALNASKQRVLFILLAVQDEAAIAEMLAYIAETEEKDIEKISSMALKISEKYCIDD